MRKLIKKILNENDFDWLSDYEFDVDRVKVGDTFKTVGGNTWFEVDKIKWNKTIPELSMVYIKRPDEGWKNQFYFKDIIKGLNTGRLDYDPNALEKIEIKEIKESNDFDWAKETNPIQCKDLKGYYFYHGNDPRKFIIDDVFIKNPRGYGRGDDLKVHYTWWNSHSDDFDWNQMNCDTFIHRVKLGDYKLFNKNREEVNPKDLAYTDNTFDDDERKEIWEQDESDDFDWIRDIKDYDFQPRDGDYIEVINLGIEKSFLDWLGDYSDFYTEGLFGPTIKGKVFLLGGNTFELGEMNTNKTIHFPLISFMDRFGESMEYPGLKLMYRPLMGDGRTT